MKLWLGILILIIRLFILIKKNSNIKKFKRYKKLFYSKSFRALLFNKICKKHQSFASYMVHKYALGDENKSKREIIKNYKKEKENYF